MAGHPPSTAPPRQRRIGSPKLRSEHPVCAAARPELPAAASPGLPAGRAWGPRAERGVLTPARRAADSPRRSPGRQVAHPAGDVDGVVAEPLVEASYQRHLVVNLGQGRGGGADLLVPAFRCLRPHVAGKLSHPLDEPAAARR